MPREIPETVETYDSLVATEDGVEFYAATPLSDKPGYDGYLIPWYQLSDRGTYFVPGSMKKTAKEQVKLAPVLYQHDPWEPIGRHVQAFEDDKGFRIGTEINEQTQRGMEVMSNLRFGTPLGISAGIERVRQRSGKESEDEKLNRKTAPAFFRDVPITDLIAIEEARWWEGSVVTFAGIGTAKPDTVHAADGSGWTVEALINGCKDGTLTTVQRSLVEQIVDAYRPTQAGAEDLDSHSTEETYDASPRLREIAALTATRARLLAQGIEL